MKFRKEIREQVEGGGFIGAKDDRALNHVAAIRNDLNGFVAQAKQLFRVFEKNLAGGGELDGLGGTVEEPGLVCLLKLANLPTARGLPRAGFLPRTPKPLPFADEHTIIT